jgi:hypothetical protein
VCGARVRFWRLRVSAKMPAVMLRCAASGPDGRSLTNGGRPPHITVAFFSDRRPASGAGNRSMRGRVASRPETPCLSGRGGHSVPGRGRVAPHSRSVEPSQRPPQVSTPDKQLCPNKPTDPAPATTVDTSDSLTAGKGAGGSEDGKAARDVAKSSRTLKPSLDVEFDDLCMCVCLQKWLSLLAR